MCQKERILKTQRDAFFEELYKVARKDKRVVLLAADMGAPALDRWREDMPDQIMNVGIAEANMVAVAAGMALDGKRPFCYGIIPFVTLRCYEAIKVNICMWNLPVTIVGVGAGLSYSEAGPTHYATEDIAIMRVLPNMQVASPSNAANAKYLAKVYDKPTYIRLDRQSPANAPSVVIVYKDRYERLWLNWLKPFVGLASRISENTVAVITVEEHLLNGGLGSIVAEYLADHNIQIPLKRVGIDDRYFYKSGGRKEIWDGEAELQSVLSEYGLSDRQAQGHSKQ